MQTYRFGSSEAVHPQGHRREVLFMTSRQLVQDIQSGSFFDNLGSLHPNELANRLTSAPLLTTDRLWSWLTQDTAAECALALPRCEHAWYDALGVLLDATYLTSTRVLILPHYSRFGNG